MFRVGYILTPIDFGGSEKVNLTFLNHVDRKLFDIYPVLLTRPWEKHNFFIREIEDKYPVFELPVALRPRDQGSDYFRVIRCFKKLLCFLHQMRIQLIHTHGYFADIIGVPAAKILKIPHVSTCHGFISNDINLELYNKVNRTVLRFSDRIISVSEQIKNDLEKSGIRKSKITVIQNAVQTSQKKKTYPMNDTKLRYFRGIKKEEYVVGYVGRLSEEKGVGYLVEAGIHLLEIGELCKIFIIGDGPQRKKLEDMVLMKGYENDIIFTGFQTNIEEWMLMLDIFVLPSLTEGTPMALLEAMSFGVPVLATRVGGVPKVIENGINGVLVNPTDSMAIAENLKILFHHPSLRKKIALKALSVIEKQHNINDWCKKIENQYTLLLGNNKWRKKIDSQNV